MLRILTEMTIAGRQFNIYGTEVAPLFLANDVARCIDYSKIKDKGFDNARMVRLIVGKQKETVFHTGQKRKMWFLTLVGLHEVLTHSSNPIAGEMLKEVQQMMNLPSAGQYNLVSSSVASQNQNVQPFLHPEFGEVRTVIIDGEPWFVGKDVATALGYKNGSRDVNVHVDEEDKLKYQISTSGQNRHMILINESGLYSLIFSSKLLSAKDFKRWVTSQVLPCIRKTGTYSLSNTLPIPTTERLLRLEVEQKRQGQQLEQTNKKLESICEWIKVGKSII